MTKEEAKSKWCPLTFATSHMQCKSDECMAWRLFSPLDPDDGYCGLAGEPRRFNNIPSEE